MDVGFLQKVWVVAHSSIVLFCVIVIFLSPMYVGLLQKFEIMAGYVVNFIRSFVACCVTD